MKMFWIWALLPILLTGCAAEETFETISDEVILPVMAQPREISVQLPEEAALPVLENGDQQIYVCENYEILLETMGAGDLNATVRSLSGYEKDQLTVLETQWEAVTRYDFVWASAGEAGDRLGRAVILDDGQYHYCMSLLRDAEEEDQREVWDALFASFRPV